MMARSDDGALCKTGEETLADALAVRLDACHSEAYARQATALDILNRPAEAMKARARAIHKEHQEAKG